MNSLTRIYLLRHAEVETRYQRVFGGRIDMDLSPVVISKRWLWPLICAGSNWTQFTQVQ